MMDYGKEKDLISEETKKGLTDFEIGIVRILRKKKITEMVHPGSITIHYNKDAKPVSAEKREIYT